MAMSISTPKGEKFRGEIPSDKIISSVPVKPPALQVTLWPDLTSLLLLLELLPTQRYTRTRRKGQIRWYLHALTLQRILRLWTFELGCHLSLSTRRAGIWRRRSQMGSRWSPQQKQPVPNGQRNWTASRLKEDPNPTRPPSTLHSSILFRYEVAISFLLLSLTERLEQQYPYEQSEDGQYYSGYDDKVHSGISYTGYSIWVRIFSRPLEASQLTTRSDPLRTSIVPSGHGSSYSHLKELVVW
jgi:hypothetical protein